MGKKVLVIEDDAIILECIEVMLEAEGIEVITAQNGQAGLELGRQHRPDLIVSDLHMPEVNGFDVFKGLRAAPETSTAPFMVITADASASVRQRCQDLGVDAFLLKPFGPDTLMQKVKQLLQQNGHLNAN